MKRFLLFTTLIISCIFLSECRKDPKPDVFKVTKVDVVADYRAAEISGTYTFNSTPNDMKIIYGEKNDLTDAISLTVNIDSEDFYTNIYNLKQGTKYYYCFECYASHSSIRSEIHSFTTLTTERPVIETSQIKGITLNSAIGGGKVVSSCGEEVTARGVCWSLNINPTLNDNYTVDSMGEGTFISRIYNLNMNTTYYVRAYATNAVGTSYGEQLSFTTLNAASEPVPATILITDVTKTSAYCQAEVVFDGGAEVTARGVCWSTSQNPTISDSYTTNGSGVGNYTSSLTNLTPNTSYYVRAYATNEKGTGYGNELVFTTLKESEKPTVKTNDVSGVVQDAAMCGGEVVDDGGAPVTARGVCWGTNSNPTIDDSHTTDGTGEGEFLSTITGLTAGTTYYVRAYATNEKGTSYGDNKVFTTSIYMELPTVSTNEVTDITGSSAVSGGNVESDGGAPVISRGVCWSTYQNPTTDDNEGMTTDGSGMGSFTSNIPNLAPNTQYYVRAYATNVIGTQYGEQVSFTTLSDETSLPTVITAEVSDITDYSAITGGEVTDDGGASVTARGVCWSTSPTPTIDEDNFTVDGSGVGLFTSEICVDKNTTYYVRAYATNVNGTAYGNEETFTSEQGQVPTGSVNGHDYVDLGLPSGLKWATCNIGANTPAEHGNYYAWGETETKTEYTTETSLVYGTTVGDIDGDSLYDAARVNWGASWRMQTEDECQELIDECTWELISICGTNGYKVTGPNGNYIFLSFGGNIYNSPTEPNDVNTYGRYWTATESGSTHAFDLAIGYSEKRTGVYYKYSGRTIRPVIDDIPETTPPTVTTDTISNITETSAECGGNVTSDGGATVTERGVCWSTSQNPTIDDNEGMTTDGSGTGSFTSNIPNLAPNTQYYVRAYATNEKGTSYGDEKSFTTLEEEEEEEGCGPDGEIDGYDYVDLGLPSGLKWATHNVGATTPEGYGDYYAWGETETKEEYTEENSLTYGLDISQLQSQGYIDGSGNLTSSHDAATANWGNNWRMPTEDEMQELVDECTWEWTTQNDVNGYKVTGPNGSCIFLPVAGYRNGSSLYYTGEYGYYWSSTPVESNTGSAYDLNIGSGGHGVGWAGRYDGQSVRPVAGGNPSEPEVTLPTVTTTNILNITQTTAKGGGNVTSDGGAEVTERGVCWSTSSDPTLSDGYAVYGSGTGSYTTSITGLMPNTTYYVRAYATNAGGTAYGENKTFTTLNEGSDDGQEPTGYVDGHGYVDLGLPSGLMWSVCNLGAESSLDYGDYYAWGEITTKDEYRPNNSLTYGVEMSDISGDAQYDAVRANWGGIWRMPTEEEMEELQNVCTWEWVTYYNIPGYKVTGTNGNHIFLPAAGYYYYSLLKHEKIGGIYWGSTPNSDNKTAYYISFESSGFDVYGLNRYDGINIRPVFTNETSEPEATLPTVTTDSISNITETSAECGGNVTSDGGAEVTARGVCWSTSQNPTIDDNEGMTTAGTGTGSFTSNIPNLAPNTQYYVRAYATNEKGTSYGDEKSFTTLEEEEEEEGCGPDGEIDGYEYIDLGLPSGLKWATHNVGATTPEGYGDYHAWGETETKEEYTHANSVTIGFDISQLQSQGYIDGSGNLTPSHDAATANWGNNWRMPTKEEMQELVDECTLSFTSQNGVIGCIVTGPNGNCIFLPAAGYRVGSSLEGMGSYSVYYWSSTPYEGGNSYRYGCDVVDCIMRLYGQPIRPVSDGNSTEPEVTLPTVTTDSISNITENSAECGGNVTSDGNGTITARGVCWSTSQNPTIDDNEGMTTAGTGTGSFTSNIPNLAPNTQYYVRAYATNEKGTSYGDEKSFTTLEEEEEETSGYINGYEYIDLGLPSGLKWATCNIGATTPEGYGNYYAWGETTTKSDYSLSNSLTYGLSISQLQSQGYIDVSGNLTSSHDAATANWGGSWRMPTKAEIQELLDECTWQWTTQGGKNGYKVTGPNGNHIFLPAAGYRGGSSLFDAGEYGYYWSSTPYESSTNYAYHLYFDSGYHGVGWGNRSRGRSVRPVAE